MAQKKNKTDKKTFWIRVICVVLAFLMVSSLLLALL